MHRTLFFSPALIITLALSTYAADGTINFTGTILDAACTVDPGSANQTVPMGSVNKASFTNVGDLASSGPIVITVNACDPSITRIAARFEGTEAAGNSQILALTPGGATGVGIGIFEADGTTLVPLNTKSVGIVAPAAGASADLNFVAKYVATAANADITAGDANSVATFTLDYN